MEGLSADLLLSGVKLMLIGMSIVFAFLLLLVWLIQRTHALINRWLPEDDTDVASVEPVVTRHASNAGGEVIAAIAAALRQHEQRG